MAPGLKLERPNKTFQGEPDFHVARGKNNSRCTEREKVPVMNSVMLQETRRYLKITKTITPKPAVYDLRKTYSRYKPSPLSVKDYIQGKL